MSTEIAWTHEAPSSPTYGESGALTEGFWAARLPWLRRRGPVHVPPAATLHAVPSDALLGGRLEEFTVMDVLQMLGLRGRGRLVVRLRDAAEQHKAAVYLEDRSVIHAELGTVRGSKALTRLFAWKTGTFHVEHCAFAGTPSIQADVDRVLLACASEYDELRVLWSTVRARGTRLRPAADSPDFEATAAPHLAEVLALCRAHGRLTAILDGSPHSDLETLRRVDELWRAGLITVEEPS